MATSTYYADSGLNVVRGIETFLDIVVVPYRRIGRLGGKVQEFKFKVQRVGLPNSRTDTEELGDPVQWQKFKVEIAQFSYRY
jgi:hypothetical protein